MSEIITSIEPGYYPTAQTLTVTFPPNTRKAIFTNGDRTPVLSEIIAYDEGPIVAGGPAVARPFIAVTQDGRGNVIYDGGFPKFYNSRVFQTANKWPDRPYTFAVLPPQFKYLGNALNFCANPTKLAAGNRKILLIGDVKRNSYCVTTSQRYPLPDGTFDPAGNVGFRDSFEAIAEAGGWDLTVVTGLSRPSGLLDFDLDYLEQYVAVIFMSSSAFATTPPSIAASGMTAGFAQSMALYRSAGSGVIIITDHTNDNFVSLADALKRNTIFVVHANFIASNYGAYFSGNVDRTSVSVGEIRRQLALNGGPGDHPLLAGMTNNEVIAAGPSESLTEVEVFTDDEIDHTKPLIIELDTPGVHRVNILVQLEDGTILTKPMLFVIMFDGSIQITDALGRTLTDETITYKAGFDYKLVLPSSMTQVATGEIKINDLLQGYFQINGETISYSWLAGTTSTAIVNSGDVITLDIKEPFEYQVSTIVTIPNSKMYYESSGAVGVLLEELRKHPYFTDIIDSKVILGDLYNFANKTFAAAKRFSPSIPTNYWRTIGAGRLGLTSSEYLALNLRIYTNQSDWATNKPIGGTVGNACIIADNNEVQYWDNTSRAWVKHPAPANLLFTVNRKAVNTRDSSNWIVQSTNTIPVTI